MLVVPDDMAGRPIGFTCSTFDLLHAGHILMLAEAKSVCDHLIVGLQNDPSVPTLVIMVCAAVDNVPEMFVPLLIDTK